MKEARSSGKKVEKLLCCFVNILGFVITPGGEEPLDTFFQVRAELAFGIGAFLLNYFYLRC